LPKYPKIQKWYLIFSKIRFSIIMTSYWRKFWILFVILSKKRIFHLKSHQHKKDIHIFVRYYLRYPKKALLFYSDQVSMYLRHNNVTERKSDFFCKQRKKMPKNLVWEKQQYHFQISKINFYKKCMSFFYILEAFRIKF